MKARAVAIASFLALAACVPGLTGLSNVARLSGDVLVSAPSGFCIDTSTSRLSAGFAVLAPCISLGGDVPPPDFAAVITVQAGAAESAMVAGEEIALRDFLISASGKTLLSLTDDPADLRILSTQAFDNRVMVHFSDQSPPPIAGLQQHEWRGFTDIGNRLVTVAVRGLEATPLSDGQGAGLLKLALSGLSDPNAEQAAAPEVGSG